MYDAVEKGELRATVGVKLCMALLRKASWMMVMKYAKSDDDVRSGGIKIKIKINCNF